MEVSYIKVGSQLYIGGDDIQSDHDISFLGNCLFFSGYGNTLYIFFTYINWFLIPYND